MRQFTRSILTALIIGSLLSAARQGTAGMRLYNTFQLKEIQVDRCEPLDTKNVFEVSDLNLYKNEGPELTVEEAPGIVVWSTVLRERTLQYGTVFNDENLKSDSGWNPPQADPKAVYFYGSTNPKECGNFKPGDKKTVNVEESPCDTYPRGACHLYGHKIIIMTDDFLNSLPEKDK